MTLNEIVKKYPELADLPVVIYMPDGRYDHVGDEGQAGSFYKHEEFEPDDEDCQDGEGTPVLVFSGN